ncbi:Release factor glutamine methyltransferase [subsurface metagenome]
MPLDCRLIEEYLRSLNLDIVLPNIKLCVFEGVYPPKLDSFLVAQEITEVVREGDRILDIGAGSGILAILAAVKGAFAVATDIDENSLSCARYNATLNKVELDVRLGSLFEPIEEGESFDIIVSNITSLPTPPNEKHDEYVTRTVDAGPDGRKYLEPLINQMPKYLKEQGCFITLHSNFSDIERTESTLENLGFSVELKLSEYPIGKTSAQGIDYFLRSLPANCYPIRKRGGVVPKNRDIQSKEAIGCHNYLMLLI